MTIVSASVSNSVPVTNFVPESRYHAASKSAVSAGTTETGTTTISGTAGTGAATPLDSTRVINVGKYRQVPLPPGLKLKGVLEENYFQTPNNFVDIYLPLLSNPALRLYMVLERAVEGGVGGSYSCYYTQEQLAIKMGKSVDTVIRATDELETFALIHVHRQFNKEKRKNEPNVYTLLELPEREGASQEAPAQQATPLSENTPSINSDTTLVSNLVHTKVADLPVSKVADLPVSKVADLRPNQYSNFNNTPLNNTLSTFHDFSKKSSIGEMPLTEKLEKAYLIFEYNTVLEACNINNTDKLIHFLMDNKREPQYIRDMYAWAKKQSSIDDPASFTAAMILEGCPDVPAPGKRLKSSSREEIPF